MAHRRTHSQSPDRFSHTCSSHDPRDLERRIFVGNLPTSDMKKSDLEDIFNPYGKIVGVSMFRGFGFVQFENVQEAEAAKEAQKGQLYKGYKIDVNMAAERRQAKARSPPRRAPYGGFAEGRDSRPRSRSPVYGRDGRDGRDGREPRDTREPREPSREPSRESRPGAHDSRYRGSESREKDPREPRESRESRSDPHARDPHARDPHARDPHARDPHARDPHTRDPHPRDPPPYRDDYERYYRGENTTDDFYRKKDERFRDPWNGRREPEASDERRPEERRRNDLYRQYYEELQRRYDTDRPVDCSVIVINKSQNREYAETVGRKVRDLGMVVDLIFLNTEVSLTQALEDVGRARTPFAIIITQQHQVHRSCTVNILFGTPQEHRNMPMQDAMVLVAHNYDAYKVEHREKEREEIARKAAKMADDVLLREPDRENHPMSLLTTITLLSENKFVTPEELESLSIYLKDKRERLMRSSGDLHAAAASHLDVQSKPPVLPPPTHITPKPSQVALVPAPNPPPSPSQQQELQAKILSLFNSGAGGVAAAAASTASPSMAPLSQGYGSSMGGVMSHSSSHLPPSQAPPMMGPRPPMPPAGPPPGVPQGYGMLPGRMPAAPGSQRPPSSASGINFDNPSVQKALDTLIQSGPSLNHLVNSGGPQQPPPRPTQGMGQGMGQAPPMSMYPRHY